MSATIPSNSPAHTFYYGPHKRSRKAHRNGIPRPAAYESGASSMPYELASIVECIGLEKTIQIATAIAKTLEAQQLKSRGKRTNKVLKRIADRTLSDQISAAVDRKMRELSATSATAATKPRRKAA